MCKQTEIARKIVQDRIRNRQSFNYGDLQREIVKAGGILQVDVGYTLGTYIRDLDENGVIEFIARKNIYKVKGF